MMRPQDLISYCGGCSSFRCTCPKRRSTKYVDRIETNMVKGHKYVTKIFGEVDSEDFKKLKSYLGTGGSCYSDRFQIRGMLSPKMLDILVELGYTINSSIRKQALDLLENKKPNR